MRIRNIFLFSILFLSFSGTANALQNFTGRVLGIEVTYMPGLIQFSLDQGSATCPSGKALVWTNPNQDNNKAVYAALLTAWASDRNVLVYLDDGDSSCVVRFVHLLK